MNSKNDDLDINYADLKRRNSMTNVRIGTDARVFAFLYSFMKKGKIKLRQVLRIIQQ